MYWRPPSDSPHCVDAPLLPKRIYQRGRRNQRERRADGGRKGFCKMSSGGPYSDMLWSNDRGYEVVTQQISPKIVTTESTRGGIMAVSAKTLYPDACVSFLNALNTDPDIRNLINFGIENVHYTLTDSGQVRRISDAYSGVQYTQGNWFILKTTEGSRSINGRSSAALTVPPPNPRRSASPRYGAVFSGIGKLHQGL